MPAAARRAGSISARAVRSKVDDTEDRGDGNEL